MVENHQGLVDCMANIRVIMHRIREMNIQARDFQCNYRQLYEVCTMGLKNKLMEIQARRRVDKGRLREFLANRVNYMVEKFGNLSQQADESRRELLRHDDLDLTVIATGSYLYVITTANETRTKSSSSLPHPHYDNLFLTGSSVEAPL